MNETKIINRLSTVGIAGNIALVVFKLYAGIAGHSGAMVSDAIPCRTCSQRSWPT